MYTTQFKANNIYLYQTGDENITRSPTKKLGIMKMTEAQTGTDYDLMFESLQIPVILIALFTASYYHQEHHHALTMKTINSRQCTERIMKMLEQRLLYESKENVNARSFAVRSTLVPFKEEKSSNTIDDTSLVFTHSMEMNLMDKNEVVRNGSQTIVKGIRGIPLTMQEMDDFFKILKKCMNTNFKRKNNVLSEIKELGKRILENKDEADEWEDAEHKDFIKSFQLLRILYQKAFKFRLGVVDGAHRATVIFNALYGYKLEHGKLCRQTPHPINRWHCSVMYESQWEIWKHDKTGKRGEKTIIYQVDYIHENSKN